MIIGTKLKLVGGTWKAVETLEVGDNLEFGGKVLSIKQDKVDIVYRYKTQLVAGNQVVLEGKRWIKIEKNKRAVKINDLALLPFFKIITEKHILMCRNFLVKDSGE